MLFTVLEDEDEDEDEITFIPKAKQFKVRYELWKHILVVLFK
jgi:hypothetical protein